MKLQLVRVLNYRDDGKEAYLQDFDCKVPGAWRESHWETYFCMTHTKGGVRIKEYGKPDVVSDLLWDLPDAEWMRVGRNHKQIGEREWEKEVEVFSWYIEIADLESFMVFMDKWSCSYEDAFLGRFEADERDAREAE